jgi:hypothetical protein
MKKIVAARLIRPVLHAPSVPLAFFGRKNSKARSKLLCSALLFSKPDEQKSLAQTHSHTLRAAHWHDFIPYSCWPDVPRSPRRLGFNVQ